MRLSILAGTLAICRLAPQEALPEWLLSGGAFISITRTPEELSVVCPDSQVPTGTVCDPGWSAMKVMGPLDLSLTGVLASLARPLANAGIPVFAVSTFDTDYLLVKQDRLPEARAALEQAGHSLRGSNTAEGQG